MNAELPYIPEDIVYKILSYSDDIDVKVAFKIKPNDIRKTFKNEYDIMSAFWQRRIKEIYHGFNLTMQFCHMTPTKAYVHVVLHYVPRENTYVFDFVNTNDGVSLTLYEHASESPFATHSL